MLAGSSTRTRPSGDAVQGGRNDLVPAHGPEQGVDGVGGDSGHVQQVAHQPSSRSEHSSMVASSSCCSSGVYRTPSLAQAADGEFDSGQRRAEVMGDGAEDGRPHGVAFGEAQHLAGGWPRAAGVPAGRSGGRRRPPAAAGRSPAGSGRRGRGGWWGRSLQCSRRRRRPLRLRLRQGPRLRQAAATSAGWRQEPPRRPANPARLKMAAPRTWKTSSACSRRARTVSSAPEALAGEITEGGGFRAGAGGFLGPAGGEVDHHGDGGRDTHKHQEGEEVLRIADGEGARPAGWRSSSPAGCSRARRGSPARARRSGRRRRNR